MPAPAAEPVAEEIIETKPEPVVPADHRIRFFSECAFHCEGRTVSSSELTPIYEVWCVANKLKRLPSHMFGKDSP